MDMIPAQWIGKTYISDLPLLFGRAVVMQGAAFTF